MGDLPKHNIRESIGHEERGTTVIQVDDIDCHGEETSLPLVETVAKLQAILESIPPEFRDSAVLNITAYGDYASASSSITFERPETDAELADRRRWLNDIDRESDARDRHDFERLKAKFG